MKEAVIVSAILKKVYFTCFLLLLFAFQATAQEKTFDKSVLSESGKQAYQTLLKVDVFALGGTGYAGIISNGEKALDTLIQEKEAIPALKKLLKISTPEGGLYALFGLKKLNCECFDDELKTFEKLSEPPERKQGEFFEIPEGNVARMAGCEMFYEKRLKVAKQIKDGQIK